MALKLDHQININLEKNKPTIVNIPVHSNFTMPKVVTIIPSCGCTTSIPNFTIEPYSMEVIEFTITRSSSGIVNVSFITEGTSYTTSIVINVN